MKFRFFAIVAILFSIAFANARRNKRREPATGVSSKDLNKHSADGAHVTHHKNAHNVCDSKPCEYTENVCFAHTGMGSTTYECLSFAKAQKKNPTKYTDAKIKAHKEKAEKANAEAKKANRRRRY